MPSLDDLIKPERFVNIGWYGVVGPPPSPLWRMTGRITAWHCALCHTNFECPDEAAWKAQRIYELHAPAGEEEYPGDTLLVCAACGDRLWHEDHRHGSEESEV